MNKFTPTKTMIESAENVFLAMAYVESIRPIVEKYQKQIIDILKPINRYDGKVITELKDSWQMEDDDHSTYCQALEIEHELAGFKVKGYGYCPLLVAEDMLRQAKRLFVDSMEPVTKLKTDDILCSKNGLDNYDKYIELSLKLLAPFVKNSKSLLEVTK